MRGSGRSHAAEARLIDGDQTLKWYSVEELFEHGFNRGELDRLVTTSSVRWARGELLEEFLKGKGLVSSPPLKPLAIYYQMPEDYFIVRTEEGKAARATLNAMGVSPIGTERCSVCTGLFPSQLLLPDPFGKVFCSECAHATR